MLSSPIDREHHHHQPHRWRQHHPAADRDWRDFQSLNLCSRCPPGFGVTRRCTLVQDTVCHSCPPGYFAPTYSRKHACWPCSRCGNANPIHYYTKITYLLRILSSFVIVIMWLIYKSYCSLIPMINKNRAPRVRQELQENANWFIATSHGVFYLIPLMNGFCCWEIFKRTITPITCFIILLRTRRFVINAAGSKYMSKPHSITKRNGII